MNRRDPIVEWGCSAGESKRKGREESEMKRFPSVATLVLIVVAVGGAVSSAQAMKGKAPAKVVVSESSVELRLAMRKLWEDHITYTRNYIISALAGLEDVGKIAERLLRNQDDIGNAIK